MKPETRVNHPQATPLAAGNTPLVGPIYQSVKFTVERAADLGAAFRSDSDSYFYSRAKNPTVRQLELLLAEVQGRPDALCVGSGVAAVSAVLLGLLSAGDHVVLFLESYRPTRYLVRTLLGRFGVTSTLLSVQDAVPGGALERVLRERPTRLVIFESPTNPSLEVVDIERVAGLCRAHGALSVLDNTFAGLHAHGGYGVDLYVHSLTKYGSGHGDVMGGAVIGSRELTERIRTDAIQLGPVLDPHAAYLILRGMKTYFVRYRHQCRSAARVAAWLQGAAPGRVKNLRYPGLVTDPGHALATRQMGGEYGAMIAFELPGGDAAVAGFLDRLRLFQLAGSLGSTESLVAPSHRFFAGDLTGAEAARAGLLPGAIRLSIGLEDPDDLIADLDQALAPAEE